MAMTVQVNFPHVLCFTIVNVCLQVTTHSKLLSVQDREELAHHVNIPPQYITLTALQVFDTEQQFSKVLR